MTERPTSDQFHDAIVRVENIIYIPGAVGDFDSTPDAFKDELCGYLPARKDAPLYAQLPVMARFADGSFEADEIAEALIRTPGFLVQAATPERHYRADGLSCSYSWGCYFTEWLYAPTEADILPVCLAWSAEMDAKDRAKAVAA